ncbi:putative vacuolar protein sorting-associated protein [Lupinus albus]|uniref:Putative vacuolar protein sorting-associated protein n=1 Tax=Lupinus albus TaxID=3870 RepID=A0A6A4PLY3_LUPAL|nr:putative vacuolar protein sorting-associated protein [Lupinus albus]
MFEAHVLHLLRRYLGEYVHGLSAEALRISVWKGDVVLKDLKLKAEALNALKLPVTVKAGFIGTITLKVPWKSLGKEPVIVLIDRVFVLAHPAPDSRTIQEEDREKLFQAKLQQIEEAESATLDAISKSKLGNPSSGNSWLSSLISTIIGNLKISISNVHIRYEDAVSNPGHPFSSGVTLAKLAAVTMDEQGNETFDASGALDRLRKSVHLERLAFYHDSDRLPWEIHKRWEDINPNEWIEIFEEGINEPNDDHKLVSKWAMNRTYLIYPINAVLQYHRLGNQERINPEIPFEKVSLVLADVSLTLTEAQYHDWIKLLEVVSRYKIYMEISHLRPAVPISKAPYLWWQYAAQATLQQQKKCYRLSWDQIRHLCQHRRQYIHLYVDSLQHSAHVNLTEIREIEKDLDSKVILLWRLLAHAKVESVKSKVAAEERRIKKKSWFSFGWGADTEEASFDDVSEGIHHKDEKLTKEEWQAINKLLSYQPEEELIVRSAKDMPSMVQFLVTVSIGQAAARIISVNQMEIVCIRFKQLQVSTKFKHHSVYCDVLLKFYGLSSPEGSLAQSVYSEKKVNALVASFVHLPIGENIDWRLSATIAPCHVTVLTESIDRVLEFVKRSKAVSPTVTLETATALQLKFEKVTRRAQEQFQMVLEEQSRFAFDIDLDAPKVRVPLRTSSSDRCDSHFLLDFGHFTLHTAESQSDERRQNLYSRFYIAGRDIAAFFTDCDSDFGNCSLVKPNYDSQMMSSPIVDKIENVYSLIDRCGVAVLFNQIKIPHPRYPSTRISIQVPNLSIHFSSERYFRIMELLNILYETMETYSLSTADSFEAKLYPWSPSDLASDGRILVWKGIGNSVATWHPCFLVLSGSYLYVFESAKSQSYQRYLSMAGRQVLEVPPTNIGGSPFCIAVSVRGMDIQKALESSSTWILDFREEEEKASWFKGLVQATYQASAPPSVNVLSGREGDGASYSVLNTTNLKAADIVINGAVVETKLFIYGKVGDTIDVKHDESLILEVVVDGGKVNVILADGDLTVKMKLHSLKIKDELLGCLSGAPHYLAVSVLTNETLSSSPVSSVSHRKDAPFGFSDDDDSFLDALSEFISQADGGNHLHNMDLGQQGLMMAATDFESLENLIHEKEIEKGKNTPHEIYFEAEGSDHSNFVSVSFSTRSSGSPDYDGIDTQMSVSMSKLEFFCNRPTIVALISFGLDLSSGNNVTSHTDTPATSTEGPLATKEKADEKGRVKGLLGFGKERVIFYLNMNVDSVTIFLNKEDDSQLATLIQESFIMDLKVHPSSLSIDGTLGNFRLCDTSLGTDQCWDWLCDLRNPGVDSLIKFKFISYSADDDDYKGYDYSLQGHLSAVRIVFLYRFVQEITVYFMELASPHNEEAIKLVDKVGGFEWLIQKYEIDGATALKLDLTLDTPIIVVPRNSISKDFIQLDLGKLHIKNEFSWYGSHEDDPSAVHIDLLHAQILDINMSVGINGCLGKSMVRECQGFDIFVRRSLRDVFRKVPTFSLEVKVDSLHGIMSDKEYKVILDCTYMNLAEEPRLPTSFREGKSDSKDTIKLLVDKVNMNSQLLLSQTVTIIGVVVNHAFLELCNGPDGESPLAHISLEGLWVSYRMTSLSETDLFVTIPKFSILDVRPDTKPEMRLMLGSSSDASKQTVTGKVPFPFNMGSFRRTSSEVKVDVDMPISTMFLMDCRWRMSSQSFVIRVQQPRVLVVPDFLIAVAEFFVPSLGALTGREETMDPKNDPISRTSNTVLIESVYKQTEDVVHLSPSKQLVADCVGIDEYTYDACGKTICLSIETDARDVKSTRFRPIIVIGHGKRLRFMNVKIENGFLLRKYTYLSYDSSYSISIEDGVDIVLHDNLPSGDKKRLMNETSGTSVYSQIESNGTQSFSFETQVVSSELTFYDGSNSFLDDSSYGEKLIRAKLDLSFMYASKEKDTWIRALVKDFTLEAGSGLIILDPVDISGGYTSVKERTNISFLSTDICIHLSLSVVSLILNLQSQASSALSFGNATALVLCTNFDRIWVSGKGTSPDNITFWRPRAPANYVVLGDCVTSRSIPPSQAVMAVSNMYGRVRKPVDFHLIGSFLDIQGYGGGEEHSVDCSLWMPIAPPGYTALGCVAHVGNQPPPNHIVHCLRSDLISSTKCSDCLFNIPPNNQLTSGFSIWRLDNAIGSFLAHSSTGCPLNDKCYNLNHLLVWNSNRVPLIGSVSDFNSDPENNNQQTSKSVNTSRWDILKSISKATNCYMSTPNFERIWWDKGSDLRRPVSIWRPIARRGYAVLGDCITEGLEPPALGIIFKNDNPDISLKPVQFTKVSHIGGKGVDEIFFWYPIAPPGYVSLGCVVTRTDEAPRADLLCCPRMDLVSQANIHEVPLSRSSSSRAPQCWSIWKVENQACTFLARSDLKKPSSRLAYIIGDSVKPKTEENINAELKLRFFSITILDSLCGMMRPLFDTTITNIKLATRGGLQGMNAVLISSIVASTFNAQLEAWEPLVEPFDAIFKFETYDNNAQSQLGLGKRVRISATSILNVNVSAANLESFVGSILSWRRQLELEQKASKLHTGVGGLQSKGEDASFSALDEDDLQTVILENKLGCDIFVKRVEHDEEIVDKLHHGDCTSVWTPPPRFSERLNVADESRQARYYIAVQILEAKGLPIVDDGNSHNFFCALRLVIDSQASEQQKLFPQSARTKCVKPAVSRINGWEVGTVKWNELFIFEVPRKAPAKLEIEVTNLAAKAGKGDVVGSLSFSVGYGANVLRKVASVRLFHQPYDFQNIRTFPLSRMVEQSNVEAMHNGCLFASTSYFERNTVTKIQQDMESENAVDGDIGFWVGLGPEGEWESVRSLLPLSVVPKSLNNEYIGMEVVMKNGKKHAIFRSLVTVVNDSDVVLNILTSLASHGSDPLLGANSSNTVVEEVFQNQCYSSSGWGNNWPALNLDNPGHWSTRDFSNSSKDFFEPPLPPGWKWASGWSIDKFQYVDKEGWAYGPDLKKLKWPPTSSKFSTKLASDVVRRRRWVRTRQTFSDEGTESLQSGANTIQPRASAVLSWTSTLRDSNQCLQVRPNFDSSQPSYSWGRAVAAGSSYIYSKDNLLDPGSRQNSVTPSLKLNELEKKDILLCCNPSSGSKQLWLSVGSDATVLNTAVNVPVYDWKISINSPMKLENRLPCPAEFSILEKTKEGNCVELHHGVISSRQSVHIYSADIQKPVYLTLFVLGGWVMEKADPILVLDPSFSNHFSSFWMIHRQSRRKLRVSIEHDMGGTSAAPKTLRIFVPYWIVNDSSLALAYRVVEVEPSENAEIDAVHLSKAVKSAKTALKSPISSMDRRHSTSRRNLQVLEVIEDNSPFPSMLSPQDYSGRSGVTMFQSQKDTYLSPRVGISVSMRHSEVYSSGISLLELENKERIDVKAFNSDGSYYKLSALLNMTSDRTKVIHFQPHTTFVNRVGCSLCLQQCDSQSAVWIHPTDPPKPFEWQSSAKVELLKLRIDGCKWSTPFSVSYEGVMRISLKKDVGDDPLLLRVSVRSGAKRSRFEVIFRPNSLSSPYRIENRSMFLPIRFRQVDGLGDSWQLLLPNSAASFLWEDLGRRRLLELLVDGTDPTKSLKYDIDEISDNEPTSAEDGPTRALRVTIVKEDKINVVKISDWMPETEPAGVLGRRNLSSMSDSQKQQLMSITDSEFHINFDLAELGISVIDHTPEEILYLSVQNLVLAYSTGLGSGISRFKLRMTGLQVDNQLPLSPMPVLFRPQKAVGETDYILKCSVTMQSNGSLDLCVYPYIGLHGPESSSAFLINIHEPVIWRLHEMIHQVKLSRLYDSQITAASVDSIIQIGVLNMSEVRFRVSMAMSPSQRPRGVLGFWASLMTALGNTENMPVRINQRFHENITMRQSAMISMATSNIQKDLLGQPLQLLSGVDILGNASSALGHMSKGVAALSMDKKFIQSRQRQENKGVEDFGDVIREGGGAFAKGIFRGVTGILTKPLEGAKTSGVEGFVQGVGKGIIGVAAQPVSGVLDLLSKTTEGANAMRMKIASAITSDEQLLRRRLPRVISGDNLLQLYDEYKAQGQVILQLAESGSFFGQVDLFKVRGKFALTDAYEDHFMLPKGRVLIVTHRRVILLQQPSNIIAQRKFIPARDPCSILWDIMWDDLGTMELTHRKKDNPKGLPSQLILYLQSRSMDMKENVRIVKCTPESHQALEVYSSIEHALSTYGPGASKGTLKNKVTKPYSPLAADGPSSSVYLIAKDGASLWSHQQMPGSAPLSSTFGSRTDHND